MPTKDNAKRKAQQAKWRAGHKEQIDAARKEWEANNIDKVAEAKKRYRENHPETSSNEYKAKYYASHRDEIRERQRQYYVSHTDAIRTRAKKWREDHKEYMRERMREYSKKLIGSDKYVARYKMANLITLGKVKRPEKCSSCGKNPGRGKDGRSLVQAHHFAGYDANNATRTVFLCINCHHETHRKEREAKRNAQSA